MIVVKMTTTNDAICPYMAFVNDCDRCYTQKTATQKNKMLLTQLRTTLAYV